MFGSRKSSKDEEILQNIEYMLGAYSALGLDAKSIAKKLFIEAKDELKKKGMANTMYDDTFGERMIANDAFMKPRLAAGLTFEDIRRFWNRPQILVLVGLKVRELADFLTANVAHKQGENLTDVAREMRRRSARYGDPTSWEQKHPANEGFTSDDADIFPEFVMRVGPWLQNTPVSEQESLVGLHTSFNALVRDLVRNGLM
jgi:hypothetical protein